MAATPNSEDSSMSQVIFSWLHGWMTTWAEVGVARRRLLELVQGDLDLLQRGNLLDMIRLRCSNVDIVHRLLSVQRRNVE